MKSASVQLTRSALSSRPHQLFDVRKLPRHNSGSEPNTLRIATRLHPLVPSGSRHRYPLQDLRETQKALVVVRSSGLNGVILLNFTTLHILIEQISTPNRLSCHTRISN